MVGKLGERDGDGNIGTDGHIGRIGRGGQGLEFCEIGDMMREGILADISATFDVPISHRDTSYRVSSNYRVRPRDKS